MLSDSLVNEFQNNPDFALYHAANRSLDMTIEHLGQERIEKIAREISYLQGLAEHHCASQAIFPCSEVGQPQFEESSRSCYVQDAGCGHVCVEQLMDQVRRGEVP